MSQYKPLSHATRVLRLYRASIKNLQSYYLTNRVKYRYECCLLRARFDQNAKIADPREAKRMLFEGEAELASKMHAQPFAYPSAPDGIAHRRNIPIPDFVLDTWHPFEKAQYPEYFRTREQRKKEHMDRYEKENN